MGGRQNRLNFWRYAPQWHAAVANQISLIKPAGHSIVVEAIYNLLHVSGTFSQEHYCHMYMHKFEYRGI